MFANLQKTIELNPITLVTGNPLEREHIRQSLCALGYELQQIDPRSSLPAGTVVLENYLSYTSTLSPLEVLQTHSCLQSRYFSNLADSKRLILVETRENFIIPSELSRFVTVYSSPRPTANQIEQLYLEHQLETTNKTIGYGRGLTTPELEIAIKEAKTVNLKGSEFWQYLDSFRCHKLSLIGLTYKSVPTKQEIGGLDLILAEIPFVKYCISPEGIERGIPRPRGNLLIGIPGTGKTYISSVFAAEMGWPMLAVSVDKLCAGGVSLLKKELEAIESMAPCIFFLDEFDKLLAKGSDPLILGLLLNWLQDHRSDVYTMAACNWLSSIPSEITRDGRFGKKFGVGFPSENARLSILEIYLGKYDERYKDLTKIDEIHLRLMAENSNCFVASELKQLVDDLAARLGMEGRQTIEIADILKAMKSHSTMYRRNPDPIDLMLREIQEQCDPAESQTSKYITPREVDAYT
jgi:ATP-dependent 26S proteasome regulatory subunit